MAPDSDGSDGTGDPGDPSDSSDPRDRGDSHDGGADADAEAAPATPPDEDIAAAERRLGEAGEPYVRATVVRRVAPISATVGDRAIVTAGGIEAGWIGGVGCAETAVLRESRAVLASGEPKLIGLAPEPESIERPGLEAFPLTCHSGGTIEVFLEPVATAPRLVVVGGSAIARAVVRGAAELDFRVTVVDPADGAYQDGVEVLATTDYGTVVRAVGSAEAVVVASVGEFDARGVAAALDLDAEYVGLIASRARAAEVVERAADLLGTSPDAVRDRVRSPAGVDIGAETPAEIAVSVLAELVDERESLGPGVDAEAGAESSPSGGQTHAAGGEGGGMPADPVCGMPVDPGDAAATIEHGGEVYHFCGQGCADAFAERPGEFVDLGPP